MHCFIHSYDYAYLINPIYIYIYIYIYVCVCVCVCVLHKQKSKQIASNVSLQFKESVMHFYNKKKQNCNEFLK